MDTQTPNIVSESKSKMFGAAVEDLGGGVRLAVVVGRGGVV